MSRIDFTPAQTTQIPTRASVPRSADSSNVSCAPRWTPPSPPVANTRIPARSARCEVAATVVAPSPLRATTGARSRTPHLATPSVFASASSAASSRPTRTSPPRIAIVAGTAPCSRTTPSISRATRRLSGRGSPWAMIVLSSATTGRPSSRAVRTSSCKCMPRTLGGLTPGVARTQGVRPLESGRLKGSDPWVVRRCRPGRPRRGSCRARGGCRRGSCEPRRRGRRRRPAWPRRRPGTSGRAGP